MVTKFQLKVIWFLCVLILFLGCGGKTKVKESYTDEESFQKAMEHKISGDSDSWSIASAMASGTTTPYGTFKLNDSTFCRRYIQGLNFAGDQQTYYGMACREPKGKWIIPRR